MNITRRILFSLVIGHWSLGISASAQSATDDALRPIAYLNGVSQQALGAETAELARSIDALMTELRRNGFPEESLTTLKQLVSQLGAVGDEDMAAIAGRLRSLGEDPALDTADAVAGAYVAQQAVEARLKSLANKIAVSQLREEAVRRLESLIARQLAAQRETRQFADGRGVPARLQLLISDQRGVGEDLEAFFQTGETLLSTLREGAEGPASAAAGAGGPGFAERVNATLLNTYAAEALERIQAAVYGDAYGRQNLLLTELNKLLQGILSSQTKEQRLASALMQVAALREEQEARDRAEQPPRAEEAQAAADEARLLAAKVAAVDPQAAQAVNAAQQALQQQADAAARNEANPASAQANRDRNQAPNTAEASAQPNAPERGENVARADGAAEADVAGNAAAENASSSEGPAENRLANGEPAPGATPPPGAPTASSTAPSAASAALAAAEAALRTQLAMEQARETGAQQAAANGPNSPNASDPSTSSSPAQSTQVANGPGQTLRNGESGEGGGGGMVANAASDGSGGTAQVVGALNREEREAMLTLQNERYPAEYAPWVQQYWRNLAQDR